MTARCPVRSRQHKPCGRPASIEIALPLMPVPWTDERWLWLGPWCRGHADAVAPVGGIARRFVGTELVA
jgi:hypothetical protein